MLAIEELQVQIEEINIELAELKTKEEQLILQKKELEHQVDSLIRQENICLILSEVSSIKESNVYVDYLDANTKTIPIIDAFISSRNKYLILKTDLHASSNNYLLNAITEKYQIAYIIAKIRKNIFVSPGPTISELKKNSLSNKKFSKSLSTLNHEIRQAVLSYFYEDCETDNPGQKENGKITLKTDYDAQETIYIPFSKLVRLEAQCSKNRTDYGNIFHGEKLVKKGTEYGETTKFIIIGLCLTKIKLNKSSSLLDLF